ncbi:MAG: hypothetical protein H7A51_10685 [Akkermansiaceae bacterium]|nr:hypothetical protein [Akkermansiaceae bacterium]
MNIRSFFKYLPVAVMLWSGAPASAEQAAARLLYNDGSHDDVLVINYANGVVTYRLNERALNIVRVGRPKLQAVYYYEPKIFSEAMDLYRGRNYEEAKPKFAECETAFRDMDTSPNNYASLAGFYKMECSRRMNKLDDLSSEMEKYRKKGLSRETHLQQLEVNTFWEAVRLKDWERLDRLAQAWHKRKVTGSQRAQIAYCHGLALEHLAKKDPKRISEALNAYNRALSADFTASMEIVLNAANNALRVYSSDPEVKLAMTLWKTEDENPNSGGHQRLLEANTLVKLYKQAGFDKITPLLPEYNKFLKYSAPKGDNAG